MCDCLICGKTMKKGSLFVHHKRFHTEKRKEEELMEFTENEVGALIQQLVSEMDKSIQELLDNIDDQQLIFKDIDMDDYLQIFDEITKAPSKIPSEEEFKDIQDYWLGMNVQEFASAEENMLDWAAKL